jgi:hypothetical protein
MIGGTSEARPGASNNTPWLVEVCDPQVNGGLPTLPTSKLPSFLTEAAGVGGQHPWAYVKAMHSPRQKHGMCLLKDGRVMVAGGTDGGQTHTVGGSVEV